MCDETSRRTHRTHARVQSSTRMKTKQSNIGYTRARCVRDARPCACARVVRRNERDIHVTDHDKRAELRRAETEVVELLAGVGFVSVVERSRDRASKQPSLPDAARVGAVPVCSLDNEKLMFC